MVRITVEVTEEDIKNGVYGDSCKCPIALALARFGAIKPNVGCFEAYAGPGDIGSNTRLAVDLPEIAREFAEQFDGELPISPISFPLEVPESWLA